MKIDWSKAPDEATHWGPAVGGYCEAWVKSDMVGWLCLPTSGGAGWIRERRLISDLVERPISEYQRLWNGEGLPPVGTECEHQGAEEDSTWFPVLILAHAKVDGAPVAVFQRADNQMIISFSDAVFFRPTMTAEEIAAEEREQEINELVETIVAHYEYPKGAESYIGLAKALHSAGYRKTEQEHGQ